MIQRARSVAIPADGFAPVLDPRARHSRSPVGLAILAALLVPGAGTALNGDLRTGVALLLAFLAAALVPVPIMAILAMFTVWLLSLVDAIDGALG